MIPPDNQPLWEAILAYHPDKPGVDLPFSRRLAIENGWTRRFAIRAIEEYKRFVFLALTTGKQVTPSEVIDQVWHLHMVYTRAYWDDFCAQVLKKPFHHSPTEGGDKENQKYRDQYSNTLEMYLDTFGEKPPEDIWPSVGKRFEGGLWRWVSLRRFWVAISLFY